MDLTQLRAQEDDAVKLVDSWPQSMRLVIYELLHRRYGCTMSNIEHARMIAWKKERGDGPMRANIP